MVKFDHAVIYNGVYYPANTEIETKEPETKAVVEDDKPTVRKPKNRASK